MILSVRDIKISLKGKQVKILCELVAVRVELAFYFYTTESFSFWEGNKGLCVDAQARKPA